MFPYLYIELSGVEKQLMMDTAGSPIIPSKGDMVIHEKIIYTVRTVIWDYDQKKILVYVNPSF